ncbi:porin family protein [Cardinium endosymbiont of Bemisia tabaci]|uniref:porin family protein n=1 Tax=Cardinium endosymbiont of Bemisia tabaci TaxID=672794 RepID=UPI000442D046|nr:porin family protein [Cardinium endosymbiont of Bemisia tabaci]CDG49868.1 Putative beta-barrel outer membrane protein [Cardinium endosymbiont cBtQ1 of Bemisia tabaci]
MKNIKKTLMAGLFACAAFNAQAEVDPFSWGAKIGPSLSFATADPGTRINRNKVSGKFFDTVFGHVGLYAEYAFNDYIGMGLELGYMKLGGTLTEDKTATEENKSTNDENDKDKTNASGSTSSIAMASHGIAVPLHLHIYPLGREEESGILKINLGVTPYLPITTTCKKNGTDIAVNKDQEGELPSYRFALHGGVGYEFPFGLAIDAKYGFGLFEKFRLVGDTPSTTIFDNAAHLIKCPTQHLTLGVGFNFMSLLT